MRRRKLLVGAMLYPLISTLPMSKPGFCQEPMSTTAIFGFIISALQAAKKYSDDLNFAQWRADVSDKLDVIISNTEKILQDLQQLRVDFKIALHDEFRLALENKLEARREVIKTLFAGLRHGQPIPPDIKRRLDTQVDELKLDLFQISQNYGFSTLPFVLSGYATLMSSMRVVRRREDEIKETVSTMYTTFFGPAVDPNIQGSFAWAKVQADNYAAHFRQVITSDLRKGTVAEMDDNCATRNVAYYAHQSQYPDLTPCHIQLITTIISGSPDDAKSITASPVKIEAPFTFRLPDGREDYTPGNFSLMNHPHDYQPQPFSNIKLPQYGLTGAQDVASSTVTHLQNVAGQLADEKKRSSDLSATIDLIKGLGLDKMFLTG